MAKFYPRPKTARPMSARSRNPSIPPTLPGSEQDHDAVQRRAQLSAANRRMKKPTMPKTPWDEEK